MSVEKDARGLHRSSVFNDCDFAVLQLVKLVYQGVDLSIDGIDLPLKSSSSLASRRLCDALPQSKHFVNQVNHSLVPSSPSLL
jgi:hypothetical protein